MTTANPLGTEPIGRLLPKYVIPAIISLLVSAAYNMVDQVLIGNSVGMLGIAATNIAFPLMTLSNAVAFLFGIGGASNYNLRLGEGDKEAADRFAGNTLSMLAIVGLAIGVVTLIFLQQLLFAFGSTETVNPMARTYMRIIAIGLPFGIFTSGAVSMIRADGSSRYAMICTVVGAVFNLGVDPIIAFVLKWGLSGLAWSTTIGQIITAGIALYYFAHKTKTLTLKREYQLPKLRLVGSICALGVSASLTQLAMAIMQVTMNDTLRYYGATSVYGSDIPLSSVGALTKIYTIFIAFTLGVGQGCQPIHGFNYGAKQYDRVRKTLIYALITASIISIGVFSVFQLFSRQLIAIFGEDSPLYVEFATRYLRIFMFMSFMNGIQPITSYFLTAIGKAFRGLLIGLTRQILFLLPLVLILPMFYGLDGAIYAGPCADAAAACMSIALLSVEFRKLAKLRSEQLDAPT